MGRFYSKEIPNLIIMMIVAIITLWCFLESWREGFVLYILVILLTCWAVFAGLSYEVSKEKIVFYKFKYRYSSMLFDEIKFLRIFGRTFSIMICLNRPVILLGLKRDEVDSILNEVNNACNKFSQEDFLVILNNAKLLRGVVQDVAMIAIVIYYLSFFIKPLGEVGFIILCFLLVSFSVSLIFKLKGIKKL